MWRSAKSTKKHFEVPARGDIAMKKELYREGIIREVYPYNFLNNVNLAQRIDDRTLEEWIRAKFEIAVSWTD